MRRGEKQEEKSKLVSSIPHEKQTQPSRSTVAVSLALVAKDKAKRMRRKKREKTAKKLVLFDDTESRCVWDGRDEVGRRGARC
jgi:ACT domain-containing protein